jgi:hypothetical protein
MSHSINFLHSVEPHEVHRPHERRRRVGVALWALALVFVVWGIVMMVSAGSVVSAALDGRDAVERAKIAAQSLDFATTQHELEQATEAFNRADEAFTWIEPVIVLPWVGTQVRAAQQMIEAGRDVTEALLLVASLGDELIRLTGLSGEQIQAMREGVESSLRFDELPSETKRAILLRLATAGPDMELVAARIAIVRSELSEISREGVMGPILQALDPIQQRLEEAQQLLHSFAVAAKLLPSFAGLDRERAYLVLLLNNAELRPGGGFIGTYGVLRVENGDIKTLVTQDSYALDRATTPNASLIPPEPLARYNEASEWWFRDSNWSPDFAVSAQQALRLFAEETAGIPPEQRDVTMEPVTFDGVIGLTPTFLSGLLALTGSIEAGGQTFTAENILDTLEYQVEIGYVGQGIPEAQRKEIIADLVNALKAKAFALPLERLSDVATLFVNGFETKQVGLYSQDTSIEEVLTDVGWGGRVTAPEETDVQLVVDANLASLKTDPKVERTIGYKVYRNNSGQFIGRTTITYNHMGSFDWKTTRYRTYTRLYAPEGTRFVRSEGCLQNDALKNPSGKGAEPQTGTELGLAWVGCFTSIEPGKTGTLSFDYELAPSVVEMIQDGSYRLLVEKQMGAAAHALTLHLDFDKTVTTVSPSEDAGRWGDDTYELSTKLDQDLLFEVGL